MPGLYRLSNEIVRIHVYLFTVVMSYIDYYDYRILISMAPLSNEIRSISSCIPQHLGPAIPEVGELLV